MTATGSGRRPRVAIVISHPVQHFCPQYASLAKGEDWEIKVFFASSMGRADYYDPSFRERIAWGNLRLDEFPHVFLSDEALPSSAALDAPMLDDELAAFDPQVVIVHGYWQKYQWRARKWAQANERLVYYISDTEIAHASNPLKRRAKSLRLRPMFAGIDRVLTVGNSNELFYHSCGVPLSRMTRMHFAIDRESYSHAFARGTQLREEVRARLGIAPGEVVVSTVGKLVGWKRQADLIRAVGAMTDDTTIRALLIGSGPDEDALRQLAQTEAGGRVVFTGFVTPDELPAHYAASDIYAHVASIEPHSLAISEALYMGLPIVVSESCGSHGPTDDVRVGHNGYLFPTGDIAALTRHLGTLAADLALRDRMGGGSRDYALAAQERSHGIFLADALRADGLL